MKILLDASSLSHNIDSPGEGSYRLKDFTPNIEVKDFIHGEEYLGLVHTETHIRKIKRACEVKGHMAEVYLTPESYLAACNAVGMSILASQQNAFALVRPPGHHAFRELASGFCLFNNIAIATQKLVNEGKRVAIIDIDGHHGDGTQRIFFETDKVLFISIHQIGVFPETGYDYEVGRGEGKGFTKNFPLQKGSGDREFLSALDSAIQLMKEYHPDIVGVSAGFDGYFKDTVLDLQYTMNAYYEAGKRLSQNFENIFAVLEGGYHEDVQECVETFVQGINEHKKS